jgi:hypothetical protein
MESDSNIVVYIDASWAAAKTSPTKDLYLTNLRHAIDAMQELERAIAEAMNDI